MSEYQQWQQSLGGQAGGNPRPNGPRAQYVPGQAYVPGQPYVPPQGYGAPQGAYGGYQAPPGGYNSGAYQQPYGQPYYQPPYGGGYAPRGAYPAQYQYGAGYDPYQQYEPQQEQPKQMSFDELKKQREAEKAARDAKLREKSAPGAAKTATAAVAKPAVVATQPSPAAKKAEVAPSPSPSTSVPPAIAPPNTPAVEPIVAASPIAPATPVEVSADAAAAATADVEKETDAAGQAESEPSTPKEDAKKVVKAPVVAEDPRESLNVVFIGHVDAGKSTIGGHLMFLTGMVDKRTLEKYEREAKEKNRESWYLSWALDTSDEERNKGITVECGRAHFATEKKRFTIIDAPGHKSFVPNMIAGASEADIGILVISARKGEFETGFDRGGQTREHAMLAKSCGLKYLFVVINKMDDPTVNYSQERFEECKEKLSVFLRTVGFNIGKDTFFLPICGLTGGNLKDTFDPAVCPWFKGQSLLQMLDELPKIVRYLDVPLRMPITDKYKDMGTVVLGKLQSGSLSKGDTLMLMPNKIKVVVDGILADDQERSSAQSGDNVKIRLRGVEEDAISAGHVLCDAKFPCSVSGILDAQVAVLEHKSIICPGYKCVMHVHSAVVEVTVKGWVCLIDRKTGKPDKEAGRPRFVRQGQVAVARLELANPICVEEFKDHPQMSRFTLRSEGTTIAIGKVLRLRDGDDSS